MGTRRGKRGKWLETAIQNTNNIYKRNEKAIVDKIATPINYNTRTGKAFYEGKSTVDFIGCKSNGQMIAFDAKEVELKNLPLKNVGEHQVKYLVDTKRMGCESFLLVYFKFNQTCYKLDIDDFVRFKESADRKSIPHEWFEDNAKEIVSKLGVPFDYLERE